MDVKIKSPDVARRLRGMGGVAYLVAMDVRNDDFVVFQARRFASKGLDFDRLCREGRVQVAMDAKLSNREARRLVSREIRRQKLATAAAQ